MVKTPSGPVTVPDQKAVRRARLAAELRANLRRRNAKGSAATDGEGDAAPATDPGTGADEPAASVAGQGETDQAR